MAVESTSTTTGGAGGASKRAVEVTYKKSASHTGNTYIVVELTKWLKPQMNAGDVLKWDTPPANVKLMNAAGGMAGSYTVPTTAGEDGSTSFDASKNKAEKGNTHSWYLGAANRLSSQTDTVTVEHFIDNVELISNNASLKVGIIEFKVRSFSDGTLTVETTPADSSVIYTLTIGSGAKEYWKILHCDKKDLVAGASFNGVKPRSYKDRKADGLPIFIEFDPDRDGSRGPRGTNPVVQIDIETGEGSDPQQIGTDVGGDGENTRGRPFDSSPPDWDDWKNSTELQEEGNRVVWSSGIESAKAVYTLADKVSDGIANPPGQNGVGTGNAGRSWIRQTMAQAVSIYECYKLELVTPEGNQDLAKALDREAPPCCPCDANQDHTARDSCTILPWNHDCIDRPFRANMSCKNCSGGDWHDLEARGSSAFIQCGWLENISKAEFTEFELRHGSSDGTTVNNKDIAYTKARMSAHISKKLAAMPGYSHNETLKGEIDIENSTPSGSVFDQKRFWWTVNASVDQTFEFYQKFRRQVEIMVSRSVQDPDNPLQVMNMTIKDLSADQVGLYVKQVLTHQASLKCGLDVNEIFKFGFNLNMSSTHGERKNDDMTSEKWESMSVTASASMTITDVIEAIKYSADNAHHTDKKYFTDKLQINIDLGGQSSGYHKLTEYAIDPDGNVLYDPAKPNNKTESLTRSDYFMQDNLFSIQGLGISYSLNTWNGYKWNITGAAKKHGKNKSLRWDDIIEMFKNLGGTVSIPLEGELKDKIRVIVGYNKHGIQRLGVGATIGLFHGSNNPDFEVNSDTNGKSKYLKTLFGALTTGEGDVLFDSYIDVGAVLTPGGGFEHSYAVRGKLLGMEYAANLQGAKLAITKTWTLVDKNSFTLWKLNEDDDVGVDFTLAAETHTGALEQAYFKAGFDAYFKKTILQFGDTCGKIVLSGKAVAMLSGGGAPSQGFEYNGWNLGVTGTLNLRYKNGLLEWAGLPFNLHPGVGVGAAANFHFGAHTNAINYGGSTIPMGSNFSATIVFGGLTWTWTAVDTFRQELMRGHKSIFDYVFLANCPLLKNLGPDEPVWTYIFRATPLRAIGAATMAAKECNDQYKKQFQREKQRIMGMNASQPPDPCPIKKCAPKWPDAGTKFQSETAGQDRYTRQLTAATLKSKNPCTVKTNMTIQSYDKSGTHQADWSNPNQGPVEYDGYKATGGGKIHGWHLQIPGNPTIVSDLYPCLYTNYQVETLAEHNLESWLLANPRCDCIVGWFKRLSEDRYYSLYNIDKFETEFKGDGSGNNDGEVDIEADSVEGVSGTVATVMETIDNCVLNWFLKGVNLDPNPKKGSKGYDEREGFLKDLTYKIKQKAGTPTLQDDINSNAQDLIKKMNIKYDQPGEIASLNDDKDQVASIWNGFGDSWYADDDIKVPSICNGIMGLLKLGWKIVWVPGWFSTSDSAEANGFSPKPCQGLTGTLGAAHGSGYAFEAFVNYEYYKTALKKWQDHILPAYKKVKTLVDDRNKGYITFPAQLQAQLNKNGVGQYEPTSCWQSALDAVSVAHWKSEVGETNLEIYAQSYRGGNFDWNWDGVPNTIEELGMDQDPNGQANVDWSYLFVARAGPRRQTSVNGPQLTQYLYEFLNGNARVWGGIPVVMFSDANSIAGATTTVAQSPSIQEAVDVNNDRGRVGHWINFTYFDNSNTPPEQITPEDDADADAAGAERRIEIEGLAIDGNAKTQSRPRNQSWHTYFAEEKDAFGTNKANAKVISDTSGDSSYFAAAWNMLVDPYFNYSKLWHDDVEIVGHSSWSSLKDLRDDLVALGDKAVAPAGEDFTKISMAPDHNGTGKDNSALLGSSGWWPDLVLFHENLSEFMALGGGNGGVGAVTYKGAKLNYTGGAAFSGGVVPYKLTEYLVRDAINKCGYYYKIINQIFRGKCLKWIHESYGSPQYWWLLPKGLLATLPFGNIAPQWSNGQGLQPAKKGAQGDHWLSMALANDAGVVDYAISGDIPATQRVGTEQYNLWQGKEVLKNIVGTNSDIYTRKFINRISKIFNWTQGSSTPPNFQWMIFNTSPTYPTTDHPTENPETQTDLKHSQSGIVYNYLQQVYSSALSGTVERYALGSGHPKQELAILRALFKHWTFSSSGSSACTTGLVLEDRIGQGNGSTHFKAARWWRLYVEGNVGDAKTWDPSNAKKRGTASAAAYSSSAMVAASSHQQESSSQFAASTSGSTSAQKNSGGSPSTSSFGQGGTSGAMSSSVNRTSSNSVSVDPSAAGTYGASLQSSANMSQLPASATGSTNVNRMGVVNNSSTQMLATNNSSIGGQAGSANPSSKTEMESQRLKLSSVAAMQKARSSQLEEAGNDPAARKAVIKYWSDLESGKVSAAVQAQSKIDGSESKYFSADPTHTQNDKSMGKQDLKHSGGVGYFDNPD